MALSKSRFAGTPRGRLQAHRFLYAPRPDTAQAVVPDQSLPLVVDGSKMAAGRLEELSIRVADTSAHWESWNSLR